MKQYHFFLYNVPQSNNAFNAPDHIIPVLSMWEGEVNAIPQPVHVREIYPTLSNVDLMAVKDWKVMLNQVHNIAFQHFTKMMHEGAVTHVKLFSWVKDEKAGGVMVDDTIN